MEVTIQGGGDKRRRGGRQVMVGAEARDAWVVVSVEQAAEAVDQGETPCVGTGGEGGAECLAVLDAVGEGGEAG
jgi:hypothetical protein